MNQIHNSTINKRLQELENENERLQRKLKESEAREETLLKTLICCVVPWWKAKKFIGNWPGEDRE